MACSLPGVVVRDGLSLKIVYITVFSAPAVADWQVRYDTAPWHVYPVALREAEEHQEITSTQGVGMKADFWPEWELVT